MVVACQLKSSRAFNSNVTEPKEEAEEKDAQIKQVMAEELVHLVQNMSQEEKDKVIQDIFMKDF